MNPAKNTVKTRLIRAIGHQTIQRPRQLQNPVNAAEHDIVHELYALQKQGLVAYKTKRNIHSPGKNLTNIRLTKQGQALLRGMKDE
jgi:hypothetical protein